MEAIGLALAVFGIVLTIALSEPILKAISKYMSDIQRRRWSSSRYRKGQLENRRHFGYEDWSVNLCVNDDGDTVQEFDAKIVNLSPQLLETLYIPFFCDSGGLSREFMKPWARSAHAELPVAFDTIDARRSQGRIAIHHVPPLRPGESRRVKWGFVLPHVFQPGDEYYNWDVEVPHYDMVGRIEFTPKWQILYCRWEIERPGHYPPPHFDKTSIDWKIILPEPGTRLHMKLGIIRRSP